MSTAKIELEALPPARAETPRDRELEDAVRAGNENLHRPRALVTDKGDALRGYEAANLAGRFASQCSGGRARLAPYRRREHPWNEAVNDLHDRLAAEEQRWWKIARAPA